MYESSLPDTRFLGDGVHRHIRGLKSRTQRKLRQGRYYNTPLVVDFDANGSPEIQIKTTFPTNSGNFYGMIYR